jgi:hypothetical protein
MRIATGIREVFGRFHNLNLLALLQDLDMGSTAREDWATTGKLLCPVAHGLASGSQVREVNILGEFANLQRACGYAAQCLGADSGAVVRFVRSWDDQTLSSDVLLCHLEEMWQERLADAEAVQEVLQSTPSSICFPGQVNLRGNILPQTAGDTQEGTAHEHAVAAGQ